MDEEESEFESLAFYDTVKDNKTLERSALHLACIDGLVDIVQALLEIKNINVKAKDNNGLTPYDITIKKSIKDLLKKHDAEHK